MSSGSKQLWDHFYSIDDIVVEEEMLSPEQFLDFPPDSFWVPKSREKDWVDNYATMQRQNSTKLISFPGDGNSKNNASSISSHKSVSQRFSPSPRSKASLIGLPKTPKSCLLDGYGGRQISNGGSGGSSRLPRSRSEPGGSLVLLNVTEPPGSPKVSCTGRVETQKGKAKRAGFWMSFKVIMRTGFGPNIWAKKRSQNRVTAA